MDRVVFFTLFSVLLLCFQSASAQNKFPYHVILSLTGDPTQMAITYTTDIDVASCVAYGTTPSYGSNACDGKMTTFNFPTKTTHRIQYITTTILTGLGSSVTYYYEITAGGFSINGQFNTVPGGDSTIRIGVYGDLGEVGTALLASTPGNIYNYASNGYFDFIIHYGDFAYNLCADSGMVGFNFLSNIENVTSMMPYMVTIGNHEPYSKNDYFDFTLIPNSMDYYKYWFSGQKTIVSNSGGDTSTFTWYSYTVGAYLMVFVISTEAVCKNEYINGNTATNQFQAQYEWLQNGLAAARASNPNGFIVVFGHRQIYDGSHTYYHSTALKYGFNCLNSQCNSVDYTKPCDFTGPCGQSLEQLFNDYHVDLVMAGHQHYYERHYPIMHVSNPSSVNTGYYQQMPNIDTYDNPNYPVYVISGAPGIEPNRILVENQCDLQSEDADDDDDDDGDLGSMEPTSTPTGSPSTGHSGNKVAVNVKVDVQRGTEVDVDVDITERAKRMYNRAKRAGPTVGPTVAPLEDDPYSDSVAKYNYNTDDNSFSILTVNPTSLCLETVNVMEAPTSTSKDVDNFCITKTGVVSPYPVKPFSMIYDQWDEVWGGCAQ